jgi:hypothetical protein
MEMESSTIAALWTILYDILKYAFHSLLNFNWRGLLTPGGMLLAALLLTVAWGISEVAARILRVLVAASWIATFIFLILSLVLRTPLSVP